MKKEYSFDFVPCHNAYCQIIFSTRKEKIELHNNGNYFECELPLSDDLYDLYTNGTYAFSDYSIDEYPAKTFLEDSKYNGKSFFKETIYYDYNLQKVIYLYKNCEDLMDHSLFPVGILSIKKGNKIEENDIDLSDMDTLVIDMDTLVINIR